MVERERCISGRGRWKRSVEVAGSGLRKLQVRIVVMLGTVSVLARRSAMIAGRSSTAVVRSTALRRGFATASKSSGGAGSLILPLGVLGASIGIGTMVSKSNIEKAHHAPDASAQETPATGAPRAAPAPQTPAADPTLQLPKAAEVPATPVAEEYKYILVGAGTASYAALKAIRASDEEGKVLIIGSEAHSPYMRPPLSKELWLESEDRARAGQFKNYLGNDASLEFKSFSEFANVDVALGETVEKLDVENKTVHLTRRNQTISYEKCLLATGGKPKLLHGMDSNDLKGRVTNFRTVEDFKHLYNRVQHGQVKRVAVVGGSFLASEISCGIAAAAEKAGKSIEIVQIFPEPAIMARQFPRFLSFHTSQLMMQKYGVKMTPNTLVNSVEWDGKSANVHTSKGETIEADHVVVAIGIEPNTQLGADAGLEIDQTNGGIACNAELEARNDVYVAGDVASYHDVVLGRRRVEHHDHALTSGQCAGANMTGAHRPYTHLSMFWSDIGDVGYTAVGRIDSELPTVSTWNQVNYALDGAHWSNEEGNKAHLSGFGKGSVFYMQGNRVVGILLWNQPEQLDKARELIKEKRVYSNPMEELKSTFE